jgi:hypothetical protein
VLYLGFACGGVCGGRYKDLIEESRSPGVVLGGGEGGGSVFIWRESVAGIRTYACWSGAHVQAKQVESDTNVPRVDSS